MSWDGVLVQVFIAPAASVAMAERSEARLIAGVGVEGDRYATASGTYSSKPHPGRQVTLFELEVIEAVARDYDLVLAPSETRRNLITRGVPVNHLVGQRFSIGEVLLIGDRLSVPCQYLADLLGKPVFKPLLHRAGLGCRILRGGTVRPGDLVAPERGPAPIDRPDPPSP